MRILRTGLRWLAQAWLILGLSLLLLLVVDRGLRVLLPEPAGAARIDPAARAPERLSAAAVAEHPWISDYWDEHEAARHTRWQSYVYWRRQPFAGALIRVDAHGFRHTPQAGAAPPDAPAVWVFGGSAVWGTAARDQGTLPAQLAQLWAERHPGRALRWLNFGESGYVSQQSALAFQLALRCGQRPALALFMDGANDVFAALQNGHAGLPQNESNRVREFNLSRRVPQLLGAWASRLEGIQGLAQLGKPPAALPPAAELGAAVAEAWWRQVHETQILARAEAVPTLHFWQPTVFERNPARADETAVIASSLIQHRDLQLAATARVRQLLAQDGDAARVDLSSVYDAAPQPLYFDFVHTSETGQRLLAAAMLPAIETALAQAQPASRPDPVCADLPMPEAPP